MLPPSSRRRTVAEVVEGVVAAKAGHVGGGVEAMGAQVHPVHVGGLDHLLRGGKSGVSD